jgi:phage shock protein E
MKKERLKRIFTWRLLLGILLGAMAGFAYYYFIGCKSGTCAITSHPLRMTFMGALMGGVLFA